MGKVKKCYHAKTLMLANESEIAACLIPVSVCSTVPVVDVLEYQCIRLNLDPYKNE
mgnify:CR=1 FL=1